VGGLVSGGGQGGGQVSGREGLAGLVGGLGDGQDVPSRLGGDRRVRPWLSAGLPGLAFGPSSARASCPPGVLPVPGASAGGAGSAADL